jgi:Pyruvate/2-oxoacid:ferredoxin oxidoreductase delta subunit
MRPRPGETLGNGVERVSEPVTGGVELHYMSGTGNTYRVARWMGDAAQARGLDVSLVAIGKPEAPRPAATDRGLLGVLFPTHGFTAPWGVLKHVARMPRLPGRRAFVAGSRAGWGWVWLRLPGFEGTGTWLVALILALKGAKVVGITGVDMPSNWTAVHPGLRPANVEDIVQRASGRVRAFADTLLDGGTLYRGWLSLVFGLLLAPVSLGYLLLGRPLLGKLFIADERCTSCGICATSCPFGAIRMLGRPKARPFWTWHCESCMRCMNVCPEDAVQAWQPGMVGLFLLASAAGIPVGIVLALSGLVRIGMAGTLVGEALSWAAVLGAWAACYALLWWLARYVPVAWLVGHSTFTRIYRRYHEPDTDLRRV